MFRRIKRNEAFMPGLGAVKAFIKSIVSILGACGAALTLVWSAAGCAARIPAQIKHLPVMDTSSIRRLAVVPFRDSDGSSIQKQLASDLTRKVSEIAGGTGNFEMVSYESIRGPLNSGQDISLNVDGLLTGDIESVTEKNSSRQEKYYEYVNKRKIERIRTVYDREVSVTFSYRLLRARDRGIIGEQRKSGTARDSKQHFGELKPALELAQGVLSSQLGGLSRELAPWTETIQLTLRKLQKPASRDKHAKALMKEANAAVKQGTYGAAEDLFSRVYRDTGSPDAGYNAALMMEAQGKIREAIALMEQLGETAAVIRMRNSAAAEQAVADYQANKDSPVNKTIREASGAILSAASSKFPNGAKITILKSSTGSQYSDLLDYVVTKVTESLMSSNITVVERSPNEALIDAEKNYQLSGNVSDADIVGIGNEYGASVIVFLSVTGSGNARQLKIEAVSVETKEKIYMETFDI